jgi:HEAT repeat protein
MLGRARISTVEALVRDLSSKDPQARVEAADAASVVVGDDGGDGGDDRARVIAALAKTLEVDLQANVRAAAALALADLGAHEALPALLVAADDDVPLVRQLAITALGEIGDERACERLRRALTDKRPEVRYQAIVAYPRLAKLSGDDGHKDAWAALRAALDDDDGQVRGRAAEACGELADAQALPKVIADRLATIAGDREEPADARVASAIALAESGDRRGSNVILDVIGGRIDEPNPGRVQAAFELAGELGLQDARSIATNAAFGLRAIFGDAGRRTAAIVALVRLGDRRAIDHVLAELDARSFGRRMLGVAIAGRAALVEAKARLQAMLRDPRGADTQAIEDALARIDGEARPSDDSP